MAKYSYIGRVFIHIHARVYADVLSTTEYKMKPKTESPIDVLHSNLQ